MKMLRTVAIAITFLLLISATASAQAQQWKNADYDAVRDFSIQSNPNGVWSYGYLTSWGAPLTLYAWGGSCDAFPNMSWWAMPGCPGPLIGHNDSDKKLCYLTWCVPVTYLLLHPGPNGELSVLRWTAPSSGKFLMETKFVGLDYAGPTSTYAYVLLNSKRSLLKAPITSYQWPLSFDPKALWLSAGDTLDFIVDWGKDGNMGYDSTGAEVKISKLAER